MTVYAVLSLGADNQERRNAMADACAWSASRSRGKQYSSEYLFENQREAREACFRAVRAQHRPFAVYAVATEQTMDHVLTIDIDVKMLELAGAGPVKVA